MTSIAMSATTSRSVRERLSVALSLLGRFPRSVQQLLFRLAVGAVFFKAGLLKLSSWESTVGLFRDEYQVPVLPPEIAAAMATTFEIGCSALLIAGLGTRVATLPLLGMLAVIQLFVYPSAWPEHLTWGAILLAVLTQGPGGVSVDRLIGLDPPAAPTGSAIRRSSSSL
jgi:putative oxidoreductase